MNAKLSKFEKDLLRLLDEDGSVTAAVTHSAEQVAAKRRGRPPLAAVKVPIKIRIDADLLAVLRRSGDGWQTRVNAALRAQFMVPAATVQTFSYTYVGEPQGVADLIDLPASSVMPPYREVAVRTGGETYAV